MRDREKKPQKNIGAWATIGLCVLGMVGFVVSLVMGGGTKEMKSNFCVGDGLPGTSILIDYSPPWWNGSQQRALAEYFSLLYRDRLHGNERVTVYGTKGSEWSGVLGVTLAMCKPVQNGSEAVLAGGADMAEPFLKNKDEKAFKKMYWPAVEKMLNSGRDEKERMNDSPVLEMVQSVSRVPDLTGRPFSRLVVISDLIQNADSVSFYREKIPAFENFRRSAHWRRLEPVALTGVEVEVLMLGRESQKLNCTADELESWWLEYFRKNGAKSVKVIRLREGI